MDVRRVIGFNVKRGREKKGLSQTKLAELSGVSQTTISRMESWEAPDNKLHGGTFPHLSQIAEILGIPWPRLVNDSALRSELKRIKSIPVELFKEAK